MSAYYSHLQELTLRSLLSLLLFVQLAVAFRPTFHAHFNSGEEVVERKQVLSSCENPYTVKAGDTCHHISQRNDIFIRELQVANPGIQCDNLEVGQTLCLPLPIYHSHTMHAQIGNKDDGENDPTQGLVFRVYIGVDWDNVYFNEIPLRQELEIHFILAFAIDTDENGNAANGKFQPFWADNLTPDMVRKLKRMHKNVKVMMSLGGDTINSKFVFFAPEDEASWVKNAVDSLFELGVKYDLDGIDIDYEHFVEGQDVSVFANCIGKLIRKLKDRGQLTVASIAPFDEVQGQYKALWDVHSDVIDYVNFQFYTCEADTSTKELIKLYHKASTIYNGSRVLMSFTTDQPEGGKDFAPYHIFDASSHLLKERVLPGMFSWAADYSASSKFQYEKQAEDLLLLY